MIRKEKESAPAQSSGLPVLHMNRSNRVKHDTVLVSGWIRAGANIVPALLWLT